MKTILKKALSTERKMHKNEKKAGEKAVKDARKRIRIHKDNPKIVLPAGRGTLRI